MSEHNLWPNLTYENRRNYLFIEAPIFWFHEKSFGKLVFDPFLRECSNLYVFMGILLSPEKPGLFLRFVKE